MKFKLLLTTLLTVAQCIEISSDTITKGSINTEWQSSKVDQGVYWSIVDNDASNFVGDLIVDGELYISADSNDFNLNVNLGGIGNQFIVSGLVSLDSRKTTFTPFYNCKADTFENSGKIWFVGAGDAGTPTMAITSSHWTNEGLVHFYQDYRSGGWVNLGWDLQSITNNGAICLNKMAYRQANTVNGTGCIDIGTDSTVWLAYTLYDVPDQTLVFTGDNGLIKADAYGKDQTYNVVGFGGTNGIGMGAPITSFSYTQGVLTISNGLTTFSFDIGDGYDESKFEKYTPDFGTGIGKVVDGGIKYNGDVVNSDRPSSCPVCEQPPTPPDNSSSISSVSSISSETSETETTSETSVSSVTSVSSSEIVSSETSISSSEIYLTSSLETSNTSEIISSETMTSTPGNGTTRYHGPAQLVTPTDPITSTSVHITSVNEIQSLTETTCPLSGTEVQVFSAGEEAPGTQPGIPTTRPAVPNTETTISVTPAGTNAPVNTNAPATNAPADTNAPVGTAAANVPVNSGTPNALGAEATTTTGAATSAAVNNAVESAPASASAPENAPSNSPVANAPDNAPDTASQTTLTTSVPSEVAPGVPSESFPSTESSIIQVQASEGMGSINSISIFTIVFLVMSLI